MAPQGPLSLLLGLFNPAWASPLSSPCSWLLTCYSYVLQRFRHSRLLLQMCHGLAPSANISFWTEGCSLGSGHMSTLVLQDCSISRGSPPALLPQLSVELSAGCRLRSLPLTVFLLAPWLLSLLPDIFSCSQGKVRLILQLSVQGFRGR